MLRSCAGWPCPPRCWSSRGCSFLSCGRRGRSDPTAFVAPLAARSASRPASRGAASAGFGRGVPGGLRPSSQDGRGLVAGSGAASLGKTGLRARPEALPGTGRGRGDVVLRLGTSGVLLCAGRVRGGVPGEGPHRSPVLDLVSVQRVQPDGPGGRPLAGARRRLGGDLRRPRPPGKASGSWASRGTTRAREGRGRRSKRRGLRPLVYVGLGSHANFFGPGAHRLDPRFVEPALISVIEAYGARPIDHAGSGRGRASPPCPGDSARSRAGWRSRGAGARTATCTSPGTSRS